MGMGVWREGGVSGELPLVYDDAVQTGRHDCVSSSGRG